MLVIDDIRNHDMHCIFPYEPERAEQSVAEAVIREERIKPPKDFDYPATSKYYCKGDTIKGLGRKFDRLPSYYFCTISSIDPELPLRLSHFRKTSGLFWVTTWKAFRIQNNFAKGVMVALMKPRTTDAMDAEVLRQEAILSLILDRDIFSHKYPELIFVNDAVEALIGTDTEADYSHLRSS